MEDAHLILLAKDYGVFGVFDGHGEARPWRNVLKLVMGWHALKQNVIETYG